MSDTTPTRLPVVRTVKVFMGDWRRGESGRTTTVGAAAVPVCTRKDARDAVRVARAAQPGWASSTPYLRGQVLYRLAEVLEARTASVADDLVAASVAADRRPLGADEARALVGAMVDRVVHWAGWPDKLGAVLGSVNSVSVPHLSTTAPMPGGLAATMPAAGTVAEAAASFADAVCAPLAAGCAVVVGLPPAAYAALVGVTEAVACSDLPPGALCVLPYQGDELPATLAAHTDVDCLDVSGLDGTAATGCIEAAAAALTRVRHDGSDPSSLARLRWCTEARTLWLPQAL